MTFRSLRYLCAMVAVLAIAACATPKVGEFANFTCSADPCPVPIAQSFPYADLQVAEKVTVKAGTTLRWELSKSAFASTHFPLQNGIRFQVDGFVCKRLPGNDLVYVCLNQAGPGEYKYTIVTEGFGARDKDPFVVNN